MATDARPAPDEVVRCLVELLGVEREVVEMAYVQRSDALERASEATRRLGELTSTEGMLPRAAAELAAVGSFDRVVVSEVVDGGMRPLTIWSDSTPEAAEAELGELSQAPVELAYPLVEHDVARRHRPEVVGSVARAGARVAAAWTRCLGWEGYVVAALAVGGEAVGLVHADATASGRPLTALDGEIAGRFAEELAGVLERAVLRHTLELHRAELRAATQWLGARLSRLEDAAAPVRSDDGADRRRIEALTPRELDVLHLMARGQTNRAIATALVVREGTVKYHVKNILRKLSATSRADAVARYARAGGSEVGG